MSDTVTLSSTARRTAFPRARLVLADGTVFEGHGFGAATQAVGEVCFNTAMTGAVAGFSYNFGGTPPVPPTASCSVSPTEIWAGDPVTANISTQNFNPKHTITYSWTATGAKASGTSTTGNVDTAGVAPGSGGTDA